MRNTAFLALGLGLIVLQGNMFRLLGWITRWQIQWWGSAVEGFKPSLILPLIVFMGVREYSVGRGAALSFAIGYLLDVLSGAPLGLFTFCSVVIFLIARMAGLRLAAQTLLTKVALALGFSFLEGVIIVILTAIFGADANRPRALARMVIPHALSTALLAPLVFSLVQWIDLITLRMPKPTEVGR